MVTEQLVNRFRDLKPNLGLKGTLEYLRSEGWILEDVQQLLECEGYRPVVSTHLGFVFLGYINEKHHQALLHLSEVRRQTNRKLFQIVPEVPHSLSFESETPLQKAVRSYDEVSKNYERMTWATPLTVLTSKLSQNSVSEP